MSDLPALTTDDFGSWFKSLWDYTPFPWQQELVELIDTEHRWPGLVDLPTGTGKTSLIDIAVFLQALDAERPPAERWMPRRIVSVVDRRIVVDQAADRAQRIAEAHAADAPPTVIATVAHRLRHLAGTNTEKVDLQDPPLLVATLRGAIARDESWMRRPDVPAVISSTVDQAGSRLLFRGYGISRTMRPIHAGLLGNDVLWLLDEVHLARPFAQTLAQVRDLRAWRTGGEHLPDRWGVVEMSATPSAGGEHRPVIGPGATRRIDDGTPFPAGGLDAMSHPVIGRRLRASKPATLRAVKVTGDRVKADIAFATACAEQARQLVNDGVGTVGVIVNRVDTARRVRSHLAEAEVNVELLTGRMRPVDRDRKVEELRDRLATGRSRSTVETPLVVVATQCIEAGADFDLDAIVTEVASLDALKQRFGRVDRDGQLSEADQQVTSVVLARSTDVKEDADDPIYGTALYETWRWLNSLDTVDFGIRRLVQPSEPARLMPQQRGAPLLLPTHLDQLCQTSVPVSGEPEVARWLHGDTDPAPDVQIVWRADIDEELIRSERRRTDEADRTSAALSERLGACPPAATEALTVSLAAARQWLAGAPTIEVSDVDGIAASPQDAPDRRSRPWITWTSGQAIAHIDDEEEDDDPRGRRDRLRPGEVIVVPTTYGGLAAGTWDPTSIEPVMDVATEALHRQGRLDVLRLVPPLAPPLQDSGVTLPTATDLEALSRTEQRQLVQSILEAIDTDQLDGITVEVIKSLRRAKARDLTITWPPGASWEGSDRRESVIISRPAEPKVETSILTGPTADTDASDDASSFTGAQHGSLEDHLGGVGAWAGMLAEHLGLDPPTTSDLVDAGCLHDEGKRDPRFQLLLHQGDEVARAALGYDLAKSRRREPSAKRRREIRRAAKYPRGARHELTSLALIDDQVSRCNDPDLVAHLVASHHGWCRPFAPALIDPTDIAVPTGSDDGSTVQADHGLHRVDAGPPDRFWRMNQRYGWFHLAWLEAILRLGDHRRSELEQRGFDHTPDADGGAR